MEEQRVSQCLGHFRVPDVEPELSLFYRHVYPACGVLEYKVFFDNDHINLKG